MTPPARQSTAAYAASQAMFDVLRNGTSKIAEQKFLLTQARDLVQTLHVKLATANGEKDAGKHEQYMDNVVKAWRSATSVYSAVFTELASITAADSSEGKEAREGHDDFAAIAASVEVAKQLAMEYKLSTYAHTARLTKSAKKAEAQEARESDEASSAPEAEESMDTATAADRHELTLLGKRPPSADENTQPRPGKIQRLSKDFPQTGNDDVKEDGASTSNAPPVTPSASKKASVAQSTSQKRQKRRVKAKGATPASVGKKVVEEDSAKTVDASGMAAQATPAQLPVPPSAEPASAGKEASLPGLEYEDVSAEVQARLKAKEDKKKAKRDEKKRKRESGDSLPEVLPVDTVVEKPQKKKAKTKLAVGGTVKEAAVDQLEKRRLSITEEPAEGRRKRVKSK